MRLQGASSSRIILRHVVPLCLPSVIVRVTLDMAGIILTAAGLGFLGLGAQPPLPEWGAMVVDRPRIHARPVVGRAMPGIAIFVVSLGFNLLGDGLRDVLDPEGGRHERAAPRVEDLRVALPTRAGRGRGGARRVASRSGASGSASSANPAPASRMTGRAILRPDCRRRREVTADRLAFDGIDLLDAARARDARHARPPHRAW